MGDSLKGFLEAIAPMLIILGCYTLFFWEIAFFAEILGVWTWGVLALTVSPFVIVFYTTIRKRAIRQVLEMLDNKPKEWNLDKTLKEYEQLLKKK